MIADSYRHVVAAVEIEMMLVVIYVMQLQLVVDVVTAVVWRIVPMLQPMV